VFTKFKADYLTSNLFKVRPAHIVLAVITVAMLVALSVWSWVSMQAHENEKHQIFSQESDASAMTFVQRESFSVLLKLEGWADKQATGRDVQIARALLGQRLGVQTQSGARTYDITSDAYRQALSNLDPLLIRIPDIADENRMAERILASPLINEFDRQTRDLSDTFQALTRAQTRAATSERATAELIQSIILLLIMFFGAILGAWITFDIVRGFKKASLLIQQREKNLDSAHQRLLLVQNMDERSRELINQVHSGLGTDVTIKHLRHILNSLLPGNNLLIELDGTELTKFEMNNPADLGIPPRDFEFMKSRAKEIITLVLMRDQQQQDVDYALRHDNLTGLANRSSYTEMVEVKAKEVNESGGVLAIFYMDVDRFGDLNSSLGYRVGDQVLVNIGYSITDSLRPKEFAARLSSDEFAVLGIYKNETEARSRALSLQNLLNADVEIEGTTAAITVSVGCAISQAAHADAAELPRCAALAMHLAKRTEQRSNFVTYNSDDHAHLMTTWQEEIAVRNALATGELKVYFQPIVLLEPRVPVGFEALLRWDRPGIGIVPPSEFLPIVNSAGLAMSVGADVISQALEAWVQHLRPAFNDVGLSDPYISINVEAVQLQDEGFADYLLAEIMHAKVPNHHVQIEVTENALIAGDEVFAQLERLRDAGIHVALDDFGTGYSNLGQTLNLPLDMLKIDKSFLEGLIDDSRKLRMLEDVTKMAKGQDLRVTAEGIETEQVANLVQSINIDYGQGYLFGKAMEKSSVSEWVRNFNK
jgi:diguanylate cyclase (GGDEF)-like protein